MERGARVYESGASASFISLETGEATSETHRKRYVFVIPVESSLLRSRSEGRSHYLYANQEDPKISR